MVYRAMFYFECYIGVYWLRTTASDNPLMNITLHEYVFTSGIIEGFHHATASVYRWTIWYSDSEKEAEHVRNLLNNTECVLEMSLLQGQMEWQKPPKYSEHFPLFPPVNFPTDKLLAEEEERCSFLFWQLTCVTKTIFIMAFRTTKSAFRLQI